MILSSNSSKKSSKPDIGMDLEALITGGTNCIDTADSKSKKQPKNKNPKCLPNPIIQDNSLVGRPLVPFFDGNEKVNESLIANENKRESVDIDARIWNPEGYFEYPKQKPNKEKSEKKKKSSSGGKESATSSHSGKKIMRILKRGDDLNDGEKISDSKMDPSSNILLTPQALLSTINKPSDFNNADSSEHIQRQLFQASTKDQSINKTPSSNKAQSSDKIQSCDKIQSSTKSSSKKGKSSKNGDKKVKEVSKLSATEEVKKNSRKGSTTLQKEDDKPKWAWSAFQSSPDPKSLPMPSMSRFQDLGNTSEDNFQLGPTNTIVWDINTMETRKMHIEPKQEQPKEDSIEMSMTQDLCKLLNIGIGNNASSKDNA